MRLVKYHGLGNDYLVWEGKGPVSGALAVALCERHRGPGGDGVLVPFATDRADLGVTIVNPDGSIAEKSGNGLRILARWWVDRGLAPGPTFTVWTGHDTVRCDVGEDGVEVQMGTLSFDPASLPVLAEGPLVDCPVVVGDRELKITAVSAGNPHCVVFWEGPEAWEDIPWRRWASELETHPWFPRRTNVQFAQMGGERRVEVRVWERGAGETAASGSSACGVVGAAVRSGRAAPGAFEVVMAGGVLSVDLDASWNVVLAGPVERVAEIVLDREWIERVRTG